MREQESVENEGKEEANGGGEVGGALRDAPTQNTLQPASSPAEPPAMPLSPSPPPALARAKAARQASQPLVTDTPPCPATVEVEAVLEVEARPVEVEHPVLDKTKDTDPGYTAIDPDTGERMRVRDDNGRILPGRASYVFRGGPPSGRPKNGSPKSQQMRKLENDKFGRLIREALRVRMEMKINGVKHDTTWREAMIQKMSHMAATGNLNAMKLLLEYGYGPPPQRTEISGPDGGALRVVFPQAFEGV